MTIREKHIAKLSEEITYDIIIIGGGATGLGTALDATYRGLKVALFEKHDFAQGTSSKSTKLLHGGVRYLAQGNIALVFSALRERGHILRNASHLCTTQEFVIPAYSFLEKYFYLCGLKFYDLLAGKLSLGKTRSLTKDETVHLLPNIKQHNLYGGIAYTDGKFDDAFMALELALNAAKLGATILNHCEVTSFIKQHETIGGVTIRDRISQKIFNVKSKVVINATGVFAEETLRLAGKGNVNNIKIQPAQGTHIVVDKKHFDTEAALMIPKTTDGRVLFAVPFFDKVVIGTTDKPISNPNIEPLASDEEIGFIIDNFNRYAKLPISKEDVLSKFAGLRPLVKKEGIQNSAKLSRDHTIADHKNGLVTITGGKWTTYRKMAEDVVNTAALAYHLRLNQLSTKEYNLEALHTLKNENVESPKLHHKYLFTEMDVVDSYVNAYVIKADDFLSRRTRLQLLDAKASLACAEKVLHILATLRKLNSDEIQKEKQDYERLIQLYLPQEIK